MARTAPPRRWRRGGAAWWRLQRLNRKNVGQGTCVGWTGQRSGAILTSHVPGARRAAASSWTRPRNERPDAVLRPRLLHLPRRLAAAHPRPDRRHPGGAARRLVRLPGRQRRRQVDQHQAAGRPPPGPLRRHQPVRRAARRPAPAPAPRLPARAALLLRQPARRRVPRLPRPAVRAGGAGARRRLRPRGAAARPRRAARAQAAQLLEGHAPALRPRPGDGPPARPAHPRRAVLGPRPAVARALQGGHGPRAAARRDAVLLVAHPLRRRGPLRPLRGHRPRHGARAGPPRRRCSARRRCCSPRAGRARTGPRTATTARGRWPSPSRSASACSPGLPAGAAILRLERQRIALEDYFVARIKAYHGAGRKLAEGAGVER